MRFVLFALVVTGSLAVGAGRDECGKYLHGRRLRTLPVQSNWDDIRYLRTQAGQTLVAFIDDNFKVRLNDLHSGRTLWNMSTRNYTPHIALTQNRAGQIHILLSRTLPHPHIDAHFIIETEVIQIPSGEKSLRQIPIGPNQSKITKHVVLPNGAELYFLHGDRSMILPLNGEPLLLAPGEVPNSEDVILSGRETPLVSVFNSSILEILELTEGKLKTLWKTRSESNGRMFGIPHGKTLVAYRSRGRMVIQNPNAANEPAQIIPTSTAEISWHQTANGHILIATESSNGDNFWVDIYNLNLQGKHLFRIPVKMRAPRFAVDWATVPQGELFVHAADNSASVYRLMNDEAKLLKRFKVEIGTGNLMFFSSKDILYLQTPGQVDGKVFVYNILKDLGETQ